ncbi:MAG: hypothetical protein ABI024_16530 [Vicinamibacterales bacterium]
MPIRNVHDHVHRVLSRLDPSAELIATGRRFIEHPGGVRESLRGELPAWCLDRVKRLTNVTSFKAAARNRDVRTLLAFGYLGVSEHPEWHPANARPLMPVPPALAALEPDFFKVLLDSIRANAKESASFRARLKAAERDVAEASARLAKMARSDTGRPPSRGGEKPLARAAAEDGIVLGLVVLMIWAVGSWVRNIGKDD